MFVFVLMLQFHCRWEVILLAVVEVCAVAPAFPRLVRIQVVGWLWVDGGPYVVASR